jgi:hypothetical protein
MNVVYEARSTNGRWGLTIVGPEGTRFPAEGALRHVGKVAGMETFEFLPGETGQWIFPTGDVTVHGGATVVKTVYLQSNEECNLLVLGQEAVVEHYGYKRRGSRIVAYVRGVETDIPAAVLAAMGLLKVENGGSIKVEPPPPLQGAMAAAFAALRSRQ